MKAKNEQKTGKRPEGTKSGSRKAVKAVIAAPTQQKTIKQVVVDCISTNSQISNNEMIAAVKAQFPKSAFDAKHASWYRSQARKGLLTGTPISISPQTSKKQTAAKSDPRIKPSNPVLLQLFSQEDRAKISRRKSLSGKDINSRLDHPAKCRD